MASAPMIRAEAFGLLPSLLVLLLLVLASLGIGGGSAFFRVVLPSISPAVLGGALLVGLHLLGVVGFVFSGVLGAWLLLGVLRSGRL